MNFEILKKACPQFVINSLFAFMFIFVIALICVLHPNNAHAEEATPNPLALDWEAPGFIENLTKQCPDLAEQEPEVFEIALKYAKSADETRIDIQNRMEKLMERGVSATAARRGAEAATFRLRPTVSGLTTSNSALFAPPPPEGTPIDEWSEWFAKQERLKVEKKQRFMDALISQCPQIPVDVLNLAHRETFVYKPEKEKTE